MDEAAHIIVAAELTNIAADSGELPAMLDAARANLNADAGCVLADAGYRSEAVFERLKDHPSELVVALGREAKQDVEIDTSRSPRTAAMGAKLQTDEGRRAYRKRKWIAEPPNGWIKNVLRVPAVQHERAAPRASRVQAREPGAEPAPDVRFASGLRAGPKAFAAGAVAPPHGPRQIASSTLNGLSLLQRTVRARLCGSIDLLSILPRRLLAPQVKREATGKMVLERHPSEEGASAR